MSSLSDQFTLTLFEAYRRAKFEAKYNATIFLGMLNDRGGLETARYLINSNQPSEGYTKLWERRRLDLTVEAIVVDDERWHSLFMPDEIAKARKRLNEYGYFKK